MDRYSTPEEGLDSIQSLALVFFFNCREYDFPLVIYLFVAGAGRREEMEYFGLLLYSV